MPFNKIRPARIVQGIQRVNCQAKPRIYAMATGKCILVGASGSSGGFRPIPFFIPLIKAPRQPARMLNDFQAVFASGFHRPLAVGRIHQHAAAKAVEL
jgi:hypothetical protein